MSPIQSEFSPEHPQRFYAQRSDRDAFGEMKLQGDKINLESILQKLDSCCWKDTLTIHLLIIKKNYKEPTLGQYLPLFSRYSLYKYSRYICI